MSLEQISKYFTEETLNEIIKKAGGINHTTFSFGSGTKKGDSYLSNVFRLKVNGVKQNGEDIQVNLIVKAISKNPGRRKLFRSADFFRNEINFYTKVIPIFEAFQKSKNAKNPFVEYPKCYATYCDGENDFIALDDLSIAGYEGASREREMDLDMCSFIMRSLGRFHAVSLALKDQQPNEFKVATQSVEEVYYAEKFRKWYSPFLKVAISVAIDAVSREYPGTKYEEKTRKFLDDTIYDRLIKIVSANSKYSVIGHGDCWSPNFMFANGGNSIRIIDFQLARCSSPAVDITFLLYSCTSNSFREKYYDQILKAYHDGASDLLRDLGSNPDEVFPYSALLSELKEYGCFGCGMGIESLPLSMLDEDDIADLEAIDTNDAILTDVWKIAPLEKQEQRSRLADAFKHAIDNGYI